MVAAHIVAPSSKLSTCRAWHAMPLASGFGVEEADENDLYVALDWLLARQASIQKMLAARHLKSGRPVLYDLSSSYFEGTHCPLARLGYNRDGKKELLQINYDLMTDERGCPVAVTVHEENVSDSKTFLPEVERLRKGWTCSTSTTCWKSFRRCIRASG
jgi:transposase